MNYEKINEQPQTKLCLDSNFNSNKTYSLELKKDNEEFEIYNKDLIIINICMWEDLYNNEKMEEKDLNFLKFKLDKKTSAKDFEKFLQENLKINSLKDYLNEAGGFSSRALRRKTYIVYANGKAATTSHFLFFKSFPKVLPGSEVIVPAKSETKKTSSAEVIGISTAIASLVGVVIALLRL